MKSDGVENPTEMEESEILIFLIIIIAAIYTSWYFFILLFSQFAKLVTDGELWPFVCFEFLRGNADRKSEVKHVVYGVLTRYLGFLPRTHQGGVCMRIEVFGVKKKPSKYET